MFSLNSVVNFWNQVFRGLMFLLLTSPMPLVSLFRGHLQDVLNELELALGASFLAHHWRFGHTIYKLYTYQLIIHTFINIEVPLNKHITYK